MKLNLSALENEARELLRLYSPQESMLVSCEEVAALVRIAKAAVVHYHNSFEDDPDLDDALRDAGLLE